MIRRACWWAIAAALALAASSVAAAGADERGGGAGSILEQRLDDVVTAGAPGVLAFVNRGDRPGRSVWRGASGVADLETGRPMRPRHRFRVGSVTKSFVATVVLQLVGEGRLSLSDTVERWLPGTLPYGDQITVHQLLNHTSGVPDNVIPLILEIYRGDRFAAWEPEQLVALVADRPQEFPAGSDWSYSNTGYVLAGMIVERATGHRLGDELERRIFGPLRLRHTSFPVSSPYISGRHSNGYSLDLGPDFEPVEGELLDLTAFNPSRAWAAGNIVSTAGDVARFYRALLGGRLLAPALLDAMTSGVETDAPGRRYGLGLSLTDSPCGTLVGHHGDAPGFSTAALNSVDGTRQVVLMINALFAPAAVEEPFDLAVEQAVQDAFAGSSTPCEGS